MFIYESWEVAVLVVVYTVDEVAAILKVSSQSVRRYIRSGALAAVRFGRGYRVSEVAIDEFLRISLVGEKREQDLVSYGPPVSKGAMGVSGSSHSSKKKRRRR